MIRAVVATAFLQGAPRCDAVTDQDHDGFAAGQDGNDLDGGDPPRRTPVGDTLCPPPGTRTPQSCS
jgi:hypothetical protein